MSKEKKEAEKKKGPLHKRRERMKRIYNAIGEHVAYRHKLKKRLRYAGFEDDPLTFSGFMFLYSLILGFVAFVLSLLYLSNPLMSILFYAIGFGGFQLLIYGLLVMISDKRVDEVEEILPDALQLVSANIRAGMTMDRAIWLSARPEFGPLEKEIKKVGSEVLGGKDITEALEGMKESINSRLLARALKLIEEGITRGGEMAHLLDETASDIRTAKSIKEQVKSNVMMYSLFIIFASVIGAPLLFAVSLYFVEITNQLWTEQLSEATESLSQMGEFIKFSGPQITPAELQLFSIVCILLTTIFGSLIIGLIQTGYEKKGIKYVPLLSTLALVIFFAVKLIISGIFGSIVGF